MNKYDYVYKMNKLCAMKNILTLAAFTILAISFNKWWIVLLYVLFHSNVKHPDED